MRTPSPFTASDADVVLRTDDGAQLRAHRRVLIEASPFFRDLFSLPQPPTTDDGVPVVDVTENSSIMEHLLLLVYPGADPTISTLSEIAELLNVAVKYDMIRATETLRRLLVSPCYIEKEPTRVYAIACRHDLEEEARLASRHTLGINVLDCPLSEDLKYITAWSYHRLLDLHRRRSEAAQAALELEENVKCLQCSASHYGGLCPPRWWSEFERRAKDELRLRPTTDVIFSLEFLAQAANTGCQHCSASILGSFAFLQRLKKRIDDLPSTI